jgi:hypothetical protein
MKRDRRRWMGRIRLVMTVCTCISTLSGQGRTAKRSDRRFDALLDGQEHPCPGPVVDSVCYTVVDQTTLDSTASRQGHVRGVDIFRIEAGKIGEKLSDVKG